MNIVADENVDHPIVEALREAGHSVSYVAEMESGISDERVLSSANEEKAILITADKDFGELYFRQHRLSTGVVLLRLSGLSGTKKSEIVCSTFKNHGKELRNSFAVVTPAGIRIHPSRDKW